MSKNAIVLFILLALVSCNKNGNNENQVLEAPEDPVISQVKDTSSPSQTTGGENGNAEIPQAPQVSKVPPIAEKWDYNILFVKFLPEEKSKVISAAELMKRVIASEEFRSRVINHTYNGKKTFVDNRGLTNEQIYNVILDGAEKLNPAINHTMDVELELYYQDTTTIGYTYPSSERIWMNKKYFNKYTPVRVSGNLMHEWLHKLGFGHSSTFNAARPYSVPYAIGYLMEELTGKIQNR